jgi:heme-degrading monooxygenase HmoA
MHARLIRLKGSPAGAEERRAAFEREALPVMRAQPGFAGVAAVGDPASGAGAVLSYWESEAAMNQSAQALAAIREQLTTGQGLEVLTVEQYEIVLLERRQPPVPGNAARISRAKGNLDVATQAFAQLRDEGLKLASSLKGFRALVAGVDRSSGRFLVISAWDTAADREAAEVATAEQRARLAATAGATDLEVEKYEITTAEIPAAVRS